MAQWTNSGYRINYDRDDSTGFAGYDYFANTVLEMAVGYYPAQLTYPLIGDELRKHVTTQALTNPNYAYSYADCTQGTDTTHDVTSADALQYLKYATGVAGPTQAQIDIMKVAIDRVFATWQAQGVGYFGDSAAFPLFVLIVPAYTPVTRTKSVYTSNDFGRVAYVGGDSVSMVATDNLQITNIDADGNGSTITMSGFDYTNWTDAANLVLSAGANGTRTLNASPSTSDILAGSASGFTSRNLTVNISAAVDDTLDSITGQLGADVNPYALSTDYYTERATVSGLMASYATASATNASMYLNNVATPISNGTIVYEGDTIYLKITSSASYGTSVTGTLTLTSGNTVSDSVVVTTEPDPNQGLEDGTLISFGHATGAIPMSDIIDFFAGAPIAELYTPPTNLGSFYRGGVNVPELVGNANIPTSSTISFSNFRNAQTVLYFKKFPAFKSANLNTISSGGTIVLAWYIFDAFGNPADWEMGYGPYIKYGCEYQYTLNPLDQYDILAGGVTSAPALTSTTPTTWTSASAWTHAGTLGFGVNMTVLQNSEVIVRGSIKMEVRHPDGGTTLVGNVPFRFNVYGP